MSRISWKLHGNQIIEDLHKKFDNWYKPETHQIAIVVNHHYEQLLLAAPDLLDALISVLPLAEAYLANAPGHPDNAKLEDARAAIVKVGRAT